MAAGFRPSNIHVGAQTRSQVIHCMPDIWPGCWWSSRSGQAFEIDADATLRLRLSWTKLRAKIPRASPPYVCLKNDRFAGWQDEPQQNGFPTAIGTHRLNATSGRRQVVDHPVNFTPMRQWDRNANTPACRLATSRKDVTMRAPPTIWVVYLLSHATGFPFSLLLHLCRAWRTSIAAGADHRFGTPLVNLVSATGVNTDWNPKICNSSCRVGEADGALVGIGKSSPREISVMIWVYWTALGLAALYVKLDMCLLIHSTPYTLSVSQDHQ